MKKYYHDESPFAYDLPAKWDLIVGSMNTEDSFIEVKEEVNEESEYDSRKRINLLLSENPKYFKSSQPLERTLSLRPFLIKCDYISVCFKYQLTNEIIDELNTAWKNELLDTHVIAPFVVYVNTKPVLWLNFYGTTVLLGANELKLWEQNGFSFTEYNIPFNSIHNTLRL